LKEILCCQETKQPFRAVYPLQLAIIKIAPPAVGHLTPQHQLMVQMCILSKSYKAAMPVLDRFVFDIDENVTGIQSVDTRLYFYYGGICYIALKQFNKAIEFFEHVISAPAIVASAIMVEAYKKYVLASLIQTGEVSDLPRYTNHSVVRIMKTVCTPYEELATAFVTRSTEDVEKVATKHAESFLRDNNMGLVGQCIQALYRQNIQRLTKTYLTLSFDNIAERIGLKDAAEAERRILNMIEAGTLFGRINQKEGTIAFEDSGQTGNMMRYLDKQLAQTMSINQKVTELDEAILCSDRYIQKKLHAERGPSGRGGDEEMGEGAPLMSGKGY